MQVSILNGTYSKGADFRTSYPVNMVPVPKQNGISAGYLRPAEGIEAFSEDYSEGSLINGITAWYDRLFMAVDSRLVERKKDGSFVSYLGLTAGVYPSTFAYSVDRLAIASGEKLHYFDGSTLTEVTDPDLGRVLDVVYIDGYFVTTDGEFIVVTELGNPLSVNPLKYGSSEIDPDPIQRLLSNRNELYVINRHTIEVFTNTGGSFFPFSRINGAHIQRGAVGQRAACVFMEAIAFVGNSRTEPPAVYIGENAQSIKISTREIDQILAKYTTEQLELIYVEARTVDGHKFLYIHLPDRTMVYDGAASAVMQEPVWFFLTSGVEEFSQYRARYFTWWDNQWICSDLKAGFSAPRLAKLTNTHGLQMGSPVRFEFGTQITWPETGGALIHQLELIALTGRVEFNTDPLIAASYTSDGLTWSQDKWIKVGKFGERMKRLVWWSQGPIRNWRAYRFTGTSDAHISVARLELGAEPLIP
jgi:hypothetical protein